ncbi:MAG: insulinase family protein [Spirochaetaceae bacterium]|jgi:Zn-dependent M16 (insulinase) family peptidase|nr:insulinase family protein [Spirochaetaceae bacterium]
MKQDERGTGGPDSGGKLAGGFTVIETAALKELDALGIWARHDRSGAEVFHILNDDPENLFAFGFATTPEDSTGVAHILEHSVLCGSRNYPLKDAFLVLAQGSLQTFLNAWTFPDKTLYPASSVNEQDYFNLMSVYGDAVFRPLLSEWTFMQEGHRLVLPAGQAPSITGVVYNEMKGSYSSLDAYAGLWSVKSVLPGTPYDFESGGDPENIPDLTWEGLRQFHESRYSPANCRIFLAGNIPTERQLRFLDEHFLSQIPGGRAAPPVAKAPRWASPRRIHRPCPAGGDPKATVFISWLCSDSADAAETLALGALTEVLLGHDGSPLMKTLIESGLGEDLSPATGLESELRETVFTAGLRGVSSEGGLEAAAAGVEALIMGELERYVREGLPQSEIEAALFSLEFANREIRRAGGPYSLTWLRRSFRGWLYGAKPWESLLFVPAFTRLKERVAGGRYFESLIKTYLLDNPHRALVILEPQADFLEKKEAALAASLAEREAALSPEERREIAAKNAELERIQSAPEDPQALAAIPHLRRGDLSLEIETCPRQLLDLSGVPALTHGLFTNGITYADIAFPLDTLDPADYHWLPLFSRAVVSVGLPGMDYAAVSSLLSLHAGGFYAALQTGSAVPGTGRTLATPAGIMDLAGRDWLTFRLKALDEKFEPALDLALSLMAGADFSDLRRLRDLVLEMKNESDSSLAPAGSSYASLRAGRSFTRSRAVDNTWRGIDQLRFVHTLSGYDTAEISRILSRLRDGIHSGGCIVNITAAPPSLDAAAALLEKRLAPLGAPRPRNPAAAEAAAFAGAETPPAAEVFSSPSLQVGFAALSIPAAPYTSREHAAELVLSHELSTGAFWEDIRMKGGAYGASSHPDGIEGVFSCSTYRDPNPLRSVAAFAALLRERGGRETGEEALEKTIIGSYARETRPRTAAEKGGADFNRFLYGIEDMHRSRKLSAIVGMESADLARAAARLAGEAAGAADARKGAAVIIAGPGAAREAAERLGVEVTPLPV